MWNPRIDPHLEEPAAIRNLSKSKLYDLMARDFFIPSRECRCVSRVYLVQVFQGTVFRVQHFELLNFELNLSIDEKVKSMHFNIGALKEKADALLVLLDRLPFGFPRSLNPEENWFSRILRMVDPWNILAGFRMRVRNAPMPTIFPMRT